MAGPVLLCTDGSDLALDALSAGLAVLRPFDHTVIVTVVEDVDDALVTGDSGMAGGTMSPAAYQEHQDALRSEGERIVALTADRLGIREAETQVLHGNPGEVLCNFAEERGANAIVIGSRGRGRIRRALFGSVSDFVVRNASCPVLVTRTLGDQED